MALRKGRAENKLYFCSNESFRNWKEVRVQICDFLHHQLGYLIKLFRFSRRPRSIEALFCTLRKLLTLLKRRRLLTQKIGNLKQVVSIYRKCKFSSKKMVVLLVASNGILKKLAETQKEYSAHKAE